MKTNYINRRNFNVFAINSLFLLTSNKFLFASETLDQEIISKALGPRYLGSPEAPIKQ